MTQYLLTNNEGLKYNNIKSLKNKLLKLYKIIFFQNYLYE